jgi:transcriptional regulator with XRE-family HTH domain
MKTRIKFLLDREKVTSAQFASEIGISASSLHHIVSGRNNPSLEVIQKILERFPQINAEWLINGKGSTFKTMVQGELFEIPEDENKAKEEDISLLNIIEPEEDIKQSEKKEVNKSIENNQDIKKNSKQVSKIILLYDDGTFDVHQK